MRTQTPSSGPEAHAGVFATTHRSVVLAAGRHSSPDAQAALDQLFDRAWAVALVKKAHELLRQQYLSEGKHEV